jgi:predicted transcriptional regulator
MKLIWEARKLRMNGYTVKEVSRILKMSENAVSNYTKGYRKAG